MGGVYNAPVLCINIHAFREACINVSKIQNSHPHTSLLCFDISFTCGGNNSRNLESLIFKFYSLLMDSSKPPKLGGLIILSYKYFIFACIYSLVTLNFASPPSSFILIQLLLQEDYLTWSCFRIQLFRAFITKGVMLLLPLYFGKNGPNV